MKDKFWMVVTINGDVSVDSDTEGRPHIYSEKDAQSRANAMKVINKHKSVKRSYKFVW